MSVSAASNFQFSTDIWKYLRYLVMLLLTAGIVFSLTGYIKKSDIPVDRKSVLSDSTSNPAARQADGLDIKPIITAHLFGNPVAKAPPPKIVKQVKKTRLKLQLHGIFSTNGEDALAIISANRKKAKHFRIGSQVMPGVKLHGVQADHVILERAGNLEKLAYKKKPRAKIIGKGNIRENRVRKPIGTPLKQVQ